MQAQQPVPTLTGRVVDQADILSAQTERTLTAMLAAHEDSTSNQIAVLTVSSLEGEPIEDFALRVARSWELGTAEFDNGVLLVVAVDDRRMRIEVGYGLEGPLPDAVASRIIRHEMRPEFKHGDFDTGVLKGVQATLGTIEGTYTPPRTASSGGQSEDVPPLLMRFLFGLMFGGLPLFFMVPTFLIAGRWGGLFFASLFVITGFAIVLFSLWGLIGSIVGYWLLVLIGEMAFRRQPGWREMREEVKNALKENKGRRVEVDLGGFTMTVGGITSSSGSSSSGGGFSSGGGGGGFSGGGGSFGGGGASGGW